MNRWWHVLIILAGLALPVDARAQVGLPGAPTASPPLASPPPGSMPRAPTLPNVNAPPGSPAWSLQNPGANVDRAPQPSPTPVPRLPERDVTGVPNIPNFAPIPPSNTPPAKSDARPSRKKQAAPTVWPSPKAYMAECMGFWSEGMTMTKRQWRASCQATLSPRG